MCHVDVKVFKAKKKKRNLNWTYVSGSFTEPLLSGKMAEFLRESSLPEKQEKGKKKNDTKEKFALERVTNLRHTNPSNIYHIHTPLPTLIIR